MAKDLLQNVFLITMKQLHLYFTGIRVNFQSLIIIACGSFFIAMMLVSCSRSRKTTNQYETIIVKPSDATASPANATAEQKIIFKYAAYMKTTADSLKNVTLYTFIDKWMKTPYKYGGIDEKGIDCSGF